MEPLTIDFAVRGYETGVNNRVSLPTLCNYLQEAAGEHADRLGFGILRLQESGVSWVLSRLHLKVSGTVPWGGTVRVKTWPSGIRGRLVALRDFVCTDADGREVLEGVSDWLTVDLRAQRILKPTDAFRALVPEGTPRVPLAAADGGGKFAALARTDAAARVLVRRGDHDFNDHVNNVHYVEWVLESVPAGFADAAVAEIDIVYRQAAHAGDELESRTQVVDASTLRHVIARLSDGAVLVTAETKWRTA